ncbi:hypothetical protein AVEN_197604-1 [Araneus ventricosus]|uniref:Uncharacterized protein n=1 Tax=Araneus ventricosus TaxID=182803 RepID=A0A4Y2QCV7_ARAVE|nr:hypothetical protein AVEN_197604-1 [Araneus ventricosus]
MMEEVKEAKYYVVMFECTPDVSHLEQISQVLKYVRVVGNVPEITERFIDFLPSWVPYESESEWLANGYLPELCLMELESFDWEMDPKLTPKEYAFLLKLNFASKCPAFVKNTNHALMSFHIILESGVRSNVCGNFVQRFPAELVENSIDEHCIFQALKAEVFFRNSNNWCANCINQPLFSLFEEQSCPENHDRVSIMMLLLLLGFYHNINLITYIYCRNIDDDDDVSF